MLLTAEEIMAAALAAAGLAEIPEDSGIIYDSGRPIKKAMFGVDMEAAEILIAKQLGYDAVITHHPKGGSPMVNLYKVMDNQIQRMVQAGVPVNKAQKVLAERQGEVERHGHVSNFDRAVSAARVLDMTFICIHTPADVIAENTVQAHLDHCLAGNPLAKLKDVLAALRKLPEYAKVPAGPVIRVGTEDSYAGKVWVTMAGGTGGGEAVAKAYFEAGVGTLVVMHMPENVLKGVREQNIGNVVVAGHMASDSIGINGIIAALEAKGIQITRMSGVIDPK
ncbi:MAG TPA: hypothetical protein GXX34_07265 [Clostridia bacterium]|nr:hypothetical protein [Clostridia bacterium]